jgi:hypothetical protein
MNVATDNFIALSESIPIHMLNDEEQHIMAQEGNAYFQTPADLKEACEGFYQMWVKGKNDHLDDTPIGKMYSKLVRVYNIQGDRAYAMCDHYLRFRIYKLIAQL